MILVSDPDFELHVGDALETLRTMPAESVDMCVTSPPYWGLRDYGTGLWGGGDPDCDHRAPPGGGTKASGLNAKRDANGYLAADRKSQPFLAQYSATCGKCGATRQDQQLGLEATPDLYVQNMVGVFREVRRVLKPHGSLWLNLGDSYAATASARDTARHMSITQKQEARARGEEVPRDEFGNVKRDLPPGLKPKDLVGVPWRVAFALQADGWYLRSDIIWSKPNPMPESCRDRPTKAHEYVFLLTKGPRYFFDQEAVREPNETTVKRPAYGAALGNNKHHGEVFGSGQQSRSLAGGGDNGYVNPAGRNVRSVWEIATHPYPEAHFATYPPELVRRCILAGSSERGVCSVCGKPWERIVERYGDVKNTDYGRESRSVVQQGGIGSTTLNGTPAKVLTTGWRPTCDHDQAPVPATVLDPFLGSGTTALVAREQGRRCIGIELSREYAELAARRLSQLSLLAEPYPETTEGKGSSDESHSPQSSFSSGSVLP